MWCSYAPAPRKLSGRPSRDARCCIRRPVSISVSASGMPASDLMRNAAGISSNNASMLGAPIVASISRTSASVCGMNGMSVPRLLDDLPVGLRVEQARELAVVARLHLEQPALTVRVAVHELRRRTERVAVVRDDLA